MNKRLQIYKIVKKVNHQMDADAIKLYAENEDQLMTLIQIMRIYSQDIGMELGVENVPDL